jgi:uncharacterized protein (DUF433 family)
MSRQTDRDPYRGRDPRQIPAYTVYDAARYLRLPEQTIRNWAYGYAYPMRAGGQGKKKALIESEANGRHDFSFLNLIELYVLSALRREHRVQMPKIRSAIEYLKSELDSPRPLISEDFQTDGLSVFVERIGLLINASANGQFAMKALLVAHLKRIDRDKHGVPVRLFPFTWSRSEQADPARVAAAPRIISMDPAVAFGRPVIRGSRVPTTEIFQRFNAGESLDELASDFGRQVEEIVEAIRCESAAA